MNLTVKKYLIENKQLSVSVVSKSEMYSSYIPVSAMIPLLLSHEERITLHFKNNQGSVLVIDALSSGSVTYEKRITDVLGTVKLFGTKSKLKNFGASYHTIMQMNHFDLIDNLTSYYKESEQQELSLIENDDAVVMVRALPSYDVVFYERVIQKFQAGGNILREYDDCFVGNEYIDVFEKE